MCVLFLALGDSLCRAPHPSSYPFIAGDTFRHFCDFVLDDDQNFDPRQVGQAATIFIQSDLLHAFFTQYHPHIQHKYILVTPNSGTDADNPMPGIFAPYLDDQKLVVWFTQNVDREHPKLQPLPIGLANQGWEHGNIKIFEYCMRQVTQDVRSHLLYMNFNINTFPAERSLVYDLFSKKSFCTVSHKKNLHNYLTDLGSHRFTLCPRGNGLDCHRTWETLLMGSFPVVKSSTLNPLYEDLPVVIIDDWSQVTEEFLNKKYEELLHKEYTWEKLYAPYWFEKITVFKKKIMDGLL